MGDRWTGRAKGAISRVVIVAGSAAAVAGCTSYGPMTVARDRFDYNSAISTSWKEQTLLNIVKVRYADMPLFLEVASIVAGYTLQTQVGGGAVFPDLDALGGDTYSAEAGGSFTDRPTITYAPITGQQFNRTFMTPIKPQSLLFLIQGGWPVDLVFPMTVDSMNGMRNGIAAGANQRRGDEGFYRTIELLREIQMSGAVGMRIQQAGEEQTTMMLFHRDGVQQDVREALDELGDLLGIPPGAKQLRVTYSQIQEEATDLAILTRSAFQIMVDFATRVDVPPEHAEEGRTPPSVPVSQRHPDGNPVRIHSSRRRPKDAFVAVPYRDHWYYIDDRDFRSKRIFTFLMVLFSLSETGGNESLPLVTIPAG